MNTSKTYMPLSLEDSEVKSEASRNRKPNKPRREPMVVYAGNESCVIVPLTQGLDAVVDLEDIDLIKGYSWSPFKCCRKVYAQSTAKGTWKNLRMHRMLLGLTDPKIECDHRDGNGLNNRRDNLRVATRLQNGKNRKKQATPTASRFKGVHYDAPNRKWRARIEKEGVRYNLGQFHTQEAAGAAYNAAALRMHGEFSRLNELPAMEVRP